MQIHRVRDLSQFHVRVAKNGVMVRRNVEAPLYAEQGASLYYAYLKCDLAHLTLSWREVGCLRNCPRLKERNEKGKQKMSTADYLNRGVHSLTTKLGLTTLNQNLTEPITASDQ